MSLSIEPFFILCRQVGKYFTDGSLGNYRKEQNPGLGENRQTDSDALPDDDVFYVFSAKLRIHHLFDFFSFVAEFLL